MSPSYSVLPEWAEHHPVYRDPLPDPNTITTVAELGKCLNDLMKAVEVTTVREVSRRCKDRLPSHTTLRTMLTGNKLPSLAVMRVFIQALAPDVELIPWTEAWHRVAQSLPQVPRQGSIPATRKV